jgi:hypothetical protein
MVWQDFLRQIAGESPAFRFSLNKESTLFTFYKAIDQTKYPNHGMPDTFTHTRAYTNPVSIFERLVQLILRFTKSLWLIHCRREYRLLLRELLVINITVILNLRFEPG